MLPKKILALFKFVDYLDKNKMEFIEKYIPICTELEKLNNQRSSLQPKDNYNDKQKYDIIQNEISEKFSPILSNVYTPVTEKLKELEIWCGDQDYSSIWNNNISAISDFKSSFNSEDVLQVMIYKKKYLTFRTETNTNFFCLQLILDELDEIFKALFDFFKDSNENEFDPFETKTVEVDTLEAAVKNFVENKGGNVKFAFSSKNFYGIEETQIQGYSTNIKNQIFMGDKIEIGDITNNSGNLIIGKGITISDSLSGRQESSNKIEELIRLLRKDVIIDDEIRQALITNFDKVKEEVLEQTPNKTNIVKWLSKTKRILENLVLSHDVKEAVQWIYDNLNFVMHRIGG